MENSLSLAAIEAELKPKVVETFDKIADAYKRLRRLQDQDIQNKLRNDSVSPAPIQADRADEGGIGDLVGNVVDLQSAGIRIARRHVTFTETAEIADT